MSGAAKVVLIGAFIAPQCLYWKKEKSQISNLNYHFKKTRKIRAK